MPVYNLLGFRDVLAGMIGAAVVGFLHYMKVGQIEEPKDEKA